MAICSCSRLETVGDAFSACATERKYFFNGKSLFTKITVNLS